MSYKWIGHSGGAGLDATLFGPGPDIVTSENNKAFIVVDLFDWQVAPSVPVPCEASIILNGLGQYVCATRRDRVLQCATTNDPQPNAKRGLPHPFHIQYLMYMMKVVFETQHAFYGNPTTNSV